MSGLDELIQKLCPDGVEYRPLEQCCNILDNKRKPVTKGSREAGEYPYYGANGIQDYVSDYIFDGTFVLVGEDGSVITSNGNPVVTWAEGKIWVNNHAHIVSEIEGVLLRYLYHFIQTVDISNYVHGNIPKLTGKDFRGLEVPVPPLEVQREIVRVLDHFTLLRQELSAELSARRKQYEYYSQELLVNSVSDYVAISSLGKWMGGKTPSMDNSDYWTNGVIPWISSKDMKSAVLSDTQDHITEEAVSGASMKMFPAGTVAIVTRSGILKHTFPVVYVPFETTINQDIKALIPAQNVSGRYVSLVMQAFSEDIRTKTKKQGGTVDSLDFQKVLEYEIPLPSYEKQMELVKKLESFDMFTNSLVEGLPAEIEARTKQYEYYRDKLLSFKRKEAV